MSRTVEEWLRVRVMDWILIAKNIPFEGGKPRRNSKGEGAIYKVQDSRANRLPRHPHSCPRLKNASIDNWRIREHVLLPGVTISSIIAADKLFPGVCTPRSCPMEEG